MILRRLGLADRKPLTKSFRSVAARALLASLALALALAGCGLGGDGGLEIEPVAGGGDQTGAPGATGAATDAALVADRLLDMAVAADGTVRVLARAQGGPELWTVAPGGELRREPLRGLDGVPTQMAVDPRSGIYLATDRSGVWKLGADGAAGRVAGSGQRGWAPDGTPAARAALGDVGAVAVGAGGELYFTEEVDAGSETVTLVRAVGPGGALRTVLGTRELPDGDAERQRAIANGFKPPAGTRATEVLLFDSTPRALAVAGDGTVYVTTRFGIVAARPDGTAAPVIAPEDPGGDTVAEEPFASEGRADQVDLDLSAEETPDLAVDDAGNLYLAQPAGRRAPEGFRWSGDLGDGAKAVAESLFDADARWRVRRVTPGGEVTTVAWAAGEVAAAGGQVYLAARAEDGRVLVVRTKAR